MEVRYSFHIRIPLMITTPFCCWNSPRLGFGWQPLKTMQAQIYLQSCSTNLWWKGCKAFRLLIQSRKHLVGITASRGFPASLGKPMLVTGAAIQQQGKIPKLASASQEEAGMPPSVSLYPPRPLISHLESENWDDKPRALEQSLPHSIKKTETELRKARVVLLYRNSLL